MTPFHLSQGYGYLLMNNITWDELQKQEWEREKERERVGELRKRQRKKEKRKRRKRLQSVLGLLQLDFTISLSFLPLSSYFILSLFFSFLLSPFFLFSLTRSSPSFSLSSSTALSLLWLTSFELMFAPAAISRRTHSLCPFSTAQWRGVCQKCQWECVLIRNVTPDLHISRLLHLLNTFHRWKGREIWLCYKNAVSLSLSFSLSLSSFLSLSLSLLSHIPKHHLVHWHHNIE